MHIKPFRINLKSQDIYIIYLILATLFIYWQIGDHDFLTFDDVDYVYENEYVKKGFTKESIRWAFTSFHSSNWHPITWLSHMIDVELYGLNPGYHHMMNLIFHIFNTVLLFHLLSIITGKQAESVIVALLFALHPLHVESVAWISERKDVLSTTFYLLTLLSYAKYVRSCTLKNYLLTIVLYTFGLMTKPMLVSLPLIMVLLDYWPLKRLFYIRQQIFEKLPFFILSILSAIVTIIVQEEGGSVASIAIIPFYIRVTNAVSSYFLYLYKMVVPYNLGVFYPHPRKVVWATFLMGTICILFFIYLAIAKRNKKPWLFVGILWYTVSLVPVSGLVQVGRQALADRYTYIPLIGIFIAIIWEAKYMFTTNARYHSKKNIININIRIVLLIFIYLTFLMVVTYKQTSIWKNGTTLYKHTIEITKDNDMMHANLGISLFKNGENDSAAYHLIKAIQIYPTAERMNNLGIIFLESFNIDSAIRCFQTAINMDPDLVYAYVNLGNAMSAKGKLKESEEWYLRVLEIAVSNVNAHDGIGLVYMRMGNIEKAIDHFYSAYKMSGDKTNLERALNIKRKLDLSVKKIEDYLMIDPNDPDFEIKMSHLEDKKKELDEVIGFYQNALKPQKGYHKNHLKITEYKLIDYILARYYVVYGLFQEIKKNEPGSPEFISKLLKIYKIQGEKEKILQLLQGEFESKSVDVNN